MNISNINKTIITNTYNKKSGRPWYRTLSSRLRCQPKWFRLHTLSVRRERRDGCSPVLLSRGSRSRPLWTTYQRLYKPTRPQPVGPKRFFCPGCWAAARTSPTSSAPSNSRPPSRTSSRSCSERDCVLSSTTGMSLSYCAFIFVISQCWIRVRNIPRVYSSCVLLQCQK